MAGWEAIASAVAAKVDHSGPMSRGLEYAANRVAPNAIPTPPEILWAFRTGLLSERQCEDMMRAHGIAFAPPPAGINPSLAPEHRQLAANWQKIYRSQQLQPQTGELLQLLNRDALTQHLTGHHVTLEDAHLYLQRQGWDDLRTRMYLLSLRNEIPGPSDLVRFAVRHVFEPDLLEALGYNAEYREQFGNWLGQQGYAYPVPGLRASPADAIDKTWSHAFWWSHWILPSAGQGYEMLQRLRATGGPNGGPRDASGEVFDSRTLQLLLRANDYPPFWRGKLTAISYRLPGLRQLTQLVDAGLTNRADLIERWQDLGYDRDNATLLSDLTLKRAAIRRHKAELSGIKGKVLSAYDLGIYPRNNAAIALYQAGIEDPDLLAQYNTHAPAEQAQIALAEPGIALQLQAADVARSTRLVRAAIQATRKAYLSGRKSADETRAQLARLGIDDSRVEEYMILWGLELDPDRKSLSVAKTMHLFRIGLLAPLAAKRRIERMGYSTDDAQLLLSEAEKDVAADQAKAQVTAARTLAQRQAALEKLVAAQRSAHNRARSELARHGTPSQLMRWYILGFLDDQTALTRLGKLDWPNLDADTWLLEARGKRADYVAKKEKANAKTIATNTGAGTNGTPAGTAGTAVP